MKKGVKSISHGTPDWLWNRLNNEFYFGLDAAASEENALCKKYLTAENDSPACDWYAASGGCPVYCNPPYHQEDIERFVNKAVCEILHTPWRTLSVLLLPAKTDQGWWGMVLKYASEIRWIYGRLQYKGNTGGARFPSVVVVFDPERIGKCYQGIIEK